MEGRGMGSICTGLYVVPASTGLWHAVPRCLDTRVDHTSIDIIILMILNECHASSDKGLEDNDS